MVPDVDISRPHMARIYDYFLGGKNHFAADRETAEKILQTNPAIRISARENRAFLGRAVRYLAAQAGCLTSASRPRWSCWPPCISSRTTTSPRRSSPPCLTRCQAVATSSPRTSRWTTPPTRSRPGRAPCAGRPLGPGPQLRRVRATRVHRPATGAPGGGARLGVAPHRGRPPTVAGRGELLRRGRQKAVIKVTNCGGQPI